MGTTGLIFGAIVAAWLAYLVPMYVKRHQAPNHQTDPASRFSESVRIVQCGPAAAADGQPGNRTRVSTPLTRRAAIARIRRQEQRAAGRRRTVVLVLGLTLLTVVGLGLAGIAPWWVVALPGALLVAFLAIARISVRAMHEQFDRRLAEVERGGVEDTVIVVGDASVSGEKARAKHKVVETGGVESVELGAPVGRPGTLWDPLPITRPTYVSATPLGGRTVRTIDLTGPVSQAQDNHPVVADAPEPAIPERTLPQAVGE